MSTMMLKVGMTPESFLISIFNRALNLARIATLLVFSVIGVVSYLAFKLYSSYDDLSFMSILIASISTVYISVSLFIIFYLKKKISAFDIETGMFGMPAHITVEDIPEFTDQEYVPRLLVNEPEEKVAIAVYEHIRLISDSFVELQPLVNNRIRKDGKLTNYSAANLIIMSQGVIQHCRNHQNRCTPHQRGLPLFEFQ